MNFHLNHLMWILLDTAISSLSEAVSLIFLKYLDSNRKSSIVNEALRLGPFGQVWATNGPQQSLQFYGFATLSFNVKFNGFVMYGNNLVILRKS